MTRSSSLCFLMLVGLAVGCEHTEARTPSVEELQQTFANVRFETEREVHYAVNNAAESHRAVVFVHVSWAMMELQQVRFAEFMRDHYRQHPNSRVLFHYVDCTPSTNGYKPLRTLPGWSDRDTFESRIEGWGELVWLKSGQVVHVERILNFPNANALTRKTDELFARIAP